MTGNGVYAAPAFDAPTVVYGFSTCDSTVIQNYDAIRRARFGIQAARAKEAREGNARHVPFWKGAPGKRRRFDR